MSENAKEEALGTGTNDVKIALDEQGRALTTEEEWQRLRIEVLEQWVHAVLDYWDQSSYTNTTQADLHSSGNRMMLRGDGKPDRKRMVEEAAKQGFSGVTGQGENDATK